VAILAGVVLILALLTRGAKIDVSPRLGCAASGDIREGSTMGRKQAIVKLGEVFGPWRRMMSASSSMATPSEP
jgi:hypothetical protein